MSGARIAVIDDDRALRLSLVDLMRSAGYRAQPFPSAETFLVSPGALLFDCIIADVRMPGMTGPALLRRLRDEGCATPAILITALRDPPLDAEAVSAGAVCLFRKPFETNALLDCVERSLSHDRPSG